MCAVLIPVLLKAFSHHFCTIAGPVQSAVCSIVARPHHPVVAVLCVYTRIGHKHQPNWLPYLLTTLHFILCVWQFRGRGEGGGSLYLLKGYSIKTSSMLSWYLKYRYTDSAYCRTCLPSKEWSSQMDFLCLSFSCHLYVFLVYSWK